MKPSTLLALVLFSISGMTLCRANLGESEAQCITRYGDESDVQTDLGYRQVGDKAATFTAKSPFGPLNVRVTFLNGMSCHESISNADSSNGLSEDQLKGILNSQSAGQKWDKRKTVFHTGASLEETYETVDWLRSDGATATFWMSGKASSQNRSGQIDLSTQQYAYAQHVYDQENGAN